jgi:hypothetical protein
VAWSRALTTKGWTRRISIQDIKQIEQIVREHIADPIIEYTHIKPVHRGHGKLTFAGASERITLQAPTIDQIIENTGDEQHLSNLRMTCKARTKDGPFFEL